MTEMLEYFMSTIMEKNLLKVSIHSAGSVQRFTVFHHS